jgi:glycosyltransferase involved in cell wall biosynthesis
MINLTYYLDTLDYGGTELNAVRTAEALDPARVRLRVVHTHASGPLLERYVALGVPLHHLPLTSLAGPDYWNQGRALSRIVREWQTDVFHSHDIYGNMFAVPWARAAGVRAVIASRRWWDSTPRRSHRVANRWAQRLAHYVTANSAAVGRLVVNEGVPESRVRVFPNFIEPDAFVPESGEWRRSMLASLGVPPGALVVGSVGRLEPVKDHSTLLRAFSDLSGLAASAHLVLVGDGSARSALEALAVQLGIAHRVSFAGARPSRPNQYQLFDIAASLSLSEGFPNSLVEAMAAGCAAVATPVGGVAEAISDPECGLLVPPGDAVGAAAAMQRLVDDPAERERMGSAARTRARLLFDRNTVIASLTDWYCSLVQSPAETP